MQYELGSILSGLASLLTAGVAIFAIIIAKEPIETYLKQSQYQYQEVKIFNQCKADEQAAEVLEAKDPEGIRDRLSSIPSQIPKDRPAGLVIAPEYRSIVEKKLIDAKSDSERAKIIEEYWNKSISKEVRTPVDLKLDVNGN